VKVSGTWWRHLPTGSDPEARALVPGDGRWQRGDVAEAIYLADSEDTVWAEWHRALAERGLPPVRQMSRDLWRFAVDLERVADLSTESHLASFGLRMPRPAREDWPPFQAVGEALAAEGWDGLLYPSAARPEGAALCVFRTDDHMPGVTPVPPPTTYEHPPDPPGE
jgi:RES domain-containing protein